jgi:Holliday junction resolvase-like predicted endonuclease
VLKALFDRLRGREAIGVVGERVAARYLAAIGYRIVARNVRVRLGLSSKGKRVWGEIDLVAYDGATLAFVEVKTRRAAGRFPVSRSASTSSRCSFPTTVRRVRRCRAGTSRPTGATEAASPETVENLAVLASSRL